MQNFFLVYNVQICIRKYFSISTYVTALILDVCVSMCPWASCMMYVDLHHKCWTTLAVSINIWVAATGASARWQRKQRIFDTTEMYSSHYKIILILSTIILIVISNLRFLQTIDAGQASIFDSCRKCVRETTKYVVANCICLGRSDFSRHTSNSYSNWLHRLISLLISTLRNSIAAKSA